MSFINKIFLLLVVIILVFACNNNNKDVIPFPEKQDINILKMARSYFSPLQVIDFKKMSAEDKNKLEIGKKLFYDSKLSQSGNINCAICHNPVTYGTVNLSVMPGNQGQMGKRNPPSLFNSHLQYAFGWDSKYKRLEDQIGGMIQSKTEMGEQDSSQVVKKIGSDQIYQELFTKAFPNDKISLTFNNLKKAIAQFIRTLSTPSRFDDYLNGDLKVLTTIEKLGIKSFIDNGCVPCHATSTIGGSMPQKFALFGYYWDFTGSKNIDKGRFELTKNSADEYVFKVSQLRNIEKTQPFFHDGSVQSLEEAIRIMGMTESNHRIEEQDINNISAFLKTLTGNVPEHSFDKK